jgi:hypothetical protein
MYTKVKWLTLFIIMISCLLVNGCNTTEEESFTLSGTIYFENGKTLDFQDMTSFIFSLQEGAESIPQNVSEWPIFFDEFSVSRSIPLSWVKSIEVVSFEPKDLYRCLFNPVVSIESVTGVNITSEYNTLEWIKVRVIDETSGEVKEQHVYFADSGAYLQSLGGSRINIRKLVFNN